MLGSGRGVAAPVLISALLVLAAPQATAPQTPAFWWRTRFPPAAVSLPGPPPEVKLDRSRLLADLRCGSLDGARLEADAGIFVWGWAYDPRNGVPAVAVLLLDHGRPVAPAVPVFRERPDVAGALGNRRLIASGWSLWLPARGPAAGEHDLQAFAVFADHRLGPLGGEVRLKGAGR